MEVFCQLEPIYQRNGTSYLLLEGCSGAAIQLKTKYLEIRWHFLVQIQIHARNEAMDVLARLGWILTLKWSFGGLRRA